MCRWLAYSGSPVLLEDLLYKPVHSLIDQSLHSRLGVETTNGDGFGVGWYGDRRRAGRVPRASSPAWNDRNLREHRRARQSRPLVFAHIRASTGTPVQQTQLPPVPPRPLAVDAQRLHRRFPRGQARPDASPSTRSSSRRSRAPPTPSCCSSWPSPSACEDDPPGAVERAVGFDRGRRPPARRRAPDPDDRRDLRRRAHLWAFRYSTARAVALAVLQHRRRHAARAAPGLTLLRELSDETRLVVSEPLGDLAGAWNEVPESTYGVISRDGDRLSPSRPSHPEDRLCVALGHAYSWRCYPAPPWRPRTPLPRRTPAPCPRSTRPARSRPRGASRTRSCPPRASATPRRRRRPPSSTHSPAPASWR